MRFKSLLLASSLLISMAVFAQPSPYLTQIKKYISTSKKSLADSSVLRLSDRVNNRINYLFPLYAALQNEQKIKRSFQDKFFYDDFSDYLISVADYQSALYYSAKGYDTLSKKVAASITSYVDTLRNVQHVDAKKYILDRTAVAKVVMINESQCKPQHRVFTVSLLQDLYNQGFRYFAVEALNNNAAVKPEVIDISSGKYIHEPVNAEMLRIAVKIGFKLVAYQDSVYSHSSFQRELVQAANIYKVLQEDSSAKIVVQASHGHIFEEQIDKYIPMALAFKRLSDIDPLTINQTDMTELSDFEYGRIFYDQYIGRYPISKPSVAIKNNQPVDLLATNGYDIVVVHPQTQYKNGRPDWYSMNGLKKEYAIKPTEKSLYLVQAYYLSEGVNKDIGLLVPADQTYNTAENGYYYLYLQPGKYKIVYRDIEYKILSVRDAEIN
ncbi:hypothetical protein [Pinibacter aurantiacus]|uniref:Erythromycin esterase family protein n=1 Tax=Pinibacter aurantiacus TaxID=2851599 RepID=A0A9E2S4H4_9BACT|nr:hypothetical protein [Pinibacter aurantiacus]MBV4355526.1 hypothetical protein [Pinibacter aurantiacus]